MSNFQDEVLLIHLHVGGVIVNFFLLTGLETGVNLSGHLEEALMGVEVIEEVFELEALVMVVLAAQVEGCGEEVMNSFGKT